MSDREILERELKNELSYLSNDRERYLDCLSGKPLSDRQTDQEVRDGLILYWNVYRRFFDPEDPNYPKARAPRKTKNKP